MIDKKIGKLFTVTPEHVALLKHAYVDWDDCEFGAPAINCKRPYGNSSVYHDMVEILNKTFKLDVEIPEDEQDFPEELLAELDQLHRETATVLQIVLRTGRLAPGTYRRSSEWSADWSVQAGA